MFGHRVSYRGDRAVSKVSPRLRGMFLATVIIGSALASGCDLLNQTPVIRKGGYSAKQAPSRLSEPDSVMKMLVYIFDRHTSETVSEFADLLYTGYVYRYDDPTDETDLELDRASEIQVYRNIFQNFETIGVDFIVEDRWTEYGEDIAPLGTTDSRMSARHPEENWRIVRVIGDMEFTNTNDQAQIIGYAIRQRFELGFRLKSTEPDSTWELASWTDRESLLSAKISQAGP